MVDLAPDFKSEEQGDEAIILWGFKGEGHNEFVHLFSIFPDDGGVENAKHFLEEMGYKYVSYSPIKTLNYDYHNLVNSLIEKKNESYDLSDEDYVE